MKFTKTTMKTALGAAGIAAVALFGPATALAAPAIQGFGVSQNLVSGPMTTAYTVSNLQPSNIAIPGFTPKGTLYQADIIARSEAGVVTPMVNNFVARGPNGQNYRVITKPVAVPNGLNPAPIPQGQESSGTLFFDVTGAAPNGVAYNDGMQDVLIWTSNVPGATPEGPNSVPGQLPNPVPPNSPPN